MSTNLKRNGKCTIFWDPFLFSANREHRINMEISISAVTDNRNFSKSLVRYSSELARLKQAAVGLDMSELSFDTLQLLFLDRADEYMRAVGCRHASRLFQVQVAAPNEANVDFMDETEFVTYIANKLRLAVTVCGLTGDTQIQLVQTIDSFIAHS